MPRGVKIKGWPIYKDEARGRVVYRCPYRDSTGRQRTETLHDLASAKRFAADVRSSRPPVRQLGTMRLHELWAYVMGTTPPSEEATLTRYEQIWRLHIEPYLGTRRLREIESPDVKRWLATLASKPFGGRSGARTIEQSRAFLHHLFEVAVEDGLASANPVTKGSRKVLPTQVHRERRILTLEEVHRLADAIQHRGDRVYLYLMALGGARLGEPAALRIRDFDGHGVTIRESVKGSSRARLGSTKTDKARRVILPSWLCEEVSELAADKLPEAWLLPSPMGQMMNPTNWRRRVFDPAAKRAGLEGVRPHDLRHSAASLWTELDIPDAARSLMLGHSLNGAGASAMTAHYTHLTPGIESAVVKALEAARPSGQWRTGMGTLWASSTPRPSSP